MQRNTLILTLLLSVAWLMPLHAASPESQTAIKNGKSLFDFGRWSDARHEFLRAQSQLTISDKYEQQQVAYYLAICAVELGHEDAEAVLKRFMTENPESVFDHDARFALASYYCTLGAMKKARRAFADVDYNSLTPARREQYDIRMGYVAFTEECYDEAYSYFDRISARSEYVDHALYYRAYIDYLREDYTKARHGFEALSQSAAYGALVPYYLIQIEFREGNYRYVVDRGNELLQRATPQHRIDLGRIIAESWFHLEDYPKTIEYLKEYQIAGGELGREGNYLLGFSLYRTARYEQAADYLRRACGADDALTQNASYHLADCSLRCGDKEAAMQAFAMASNAKFNPALAEEALFNYGKLQYELGGGRFNEAIHVLGRYLENYPSSPRLAEAKSLLIAAYYNSNNYEAAYQAIKAYPTPDAEIREALQKIAYYRGIEAYKNGNMTEAQRFLEESAAVDVSPKYAALTLFWQGEIAFARGDRATAATHYKGYLTRAPKRAPEYALAYYNLGYCAFADQDMAQAQTSFLRFLNLYTTADHYRADAENRLGDTYYAARKFDEAMACYERVTGVTSDARYYAQYQRAVTLGIVGNTEAKCRALRQIMAADGGDYVDDAAYDLGHSYIAQERYKQGAEILEKFVVDYSNSEYYVAALSDLGLAYLNLGDRQRALKYYDRVVLAAPQSTEARGAMQGVREIYLSDGDADGYFDYAKKVGAEGDLTIVMRDSLSFGAAQKLYLSGRAADAEKSLRSYVKSYPKGYYMDDALFYLSDCYLKSGERSQAIETLTQLSTQANNAYMVDVLGRLSQMTYEDKRYAEAATAYRRLYDAVPDAKAKQTAMTGYVRATLATTDPVAITTMAADVAAHADAGKTALRESQFALAQQYDHNGREEEALEIYKRLSAEVQTPQGAESRYRMVEHLHKSGDLKRTEDAVNAFAKQNSPQAYWLAKSYILLGDLYAAKGDAFQARATYQSIADGYSPADDGIVAEAKARISKLK